MTRKETEQRLRMSMQQELPDRDALWGKIESSLPDVQQQTAPERPKIRRSAAVRAVAMAACFVLVIGGIGVFAAVNAGKKNSLTMNEAAPAPAAEFAADSAADSAAEENEAPERNPEDAADGEQEFSPEAENSVPAAIADQAVGSSVDDGASTAEDAPNAGDRAENGEAAVYEALNFGEPFLIEDAAGLSGLVEGFLTVDYVLHETAPNLSDAGSRGLCVAIRYSEERVVYLTMQEGVNRMVEMRGIHARVYRMPQEVEDFLNAQMMD